MSCNGPECPNHGPVLEIEDIGCPYCHAIRGAYMQGREDAAQDVQHVTDYAFKSAGIMHAFIKRSDAIQAAKGE